MLIRAARNSCICMTKLNTARTVLKIVIMSADTIRICRFFKHDHGVSRVIFFNRSIYLSFSISQSITGLTFLDVSLVFFNQTVEIKIKMDCEGCERKVRRSVEGMKGVTSVEVSPKLNKLTVTGYVDPEKVVARVAHRTGKKAEFWPYVPYDVVAHPYASGVYDKKAPAGYVRRAEDPQVSQLARASSTEVRYTTAFSDENPAACVVM